MFSLADFVKENIHIYFDDVPCVCMLTKNPLTGNYVPTVNFGIGSFIETYDVVPPYLILQSWNGKVVRAKIMLLGITLDCDNQFKFDLQIGVSFEISIKLLYERRVENKND